MHKDLGYIYSSSMCFMGEKDKLDKSKDIFVSKGNLCGVYIALSRQQFLDLVKFIGPISSSHM